MKLTNKLNLPQPIFDAVKNDKYTPGERADISVTQLLRPPRQVALMRAHRDEISEDCSDRIWSLLGQAVHTILERANSTGTSERRLSIDIEGWKVTGAMDIHYADGLLQDYKVVTAWKFKDGNAAPEFEQQLNLYAEILRANNEKVTRLEVVAILRDWSKLEAARDAQYPQSQILVVSVPLWPAEQARAYLRERVILHKQARVTLPMCTAEERWAKPDTFAVFKQGGKRALRVYESEDEAHGHAAQNAALFVQNRPGVNTMCEFYCSAAPFCQQFQLLKQAKVEAKEEAEALA